MLKQRKWSLHLAEPAAIVVDESDSVFSPSISLKKAAYWADVVRYWLNLSIVIVASQRFR